MTKPNSKPIILIADTEGFRLKALQIQIDKHGFETYVCGTAAEALALFTKIIPDISFVEMHLPDMDGLELLTKLKGKDPQAKVVLLSAMTKSSNDLDEEIQRNIQLLSYREKGANGLLVKPINKYSILQKVGELLNLQINY